MPTLHALLVSIDNYPNPSHVLHGCVNDGMHLHQYLEKYCEQMGFTFRPLVLIDSAATRQSVINGFNHFQGAEASDCCLFHFSGHGARSAAPEEFWDIESDHSLESIVCWDSRLPGGHDLMDKELSYLIWQAAKGKDLPIVTIMDCCHSGQMRGIAAEPVGVRELHDIGQALTPAQFLGIEHYKKTSKGQFSPPLGRRVHLAASRDTQEAKEVIVGGRPRGIFTYSLIEALSGTGPLISYADLLNRVNLRISQIVNDQSAQLTATYAEDQNLGFLFSPLHASRASYLAAWDKALGAWILNAGALHGIPEGNPANRTILELSDNQHLVTVERVLPNKSVLSGLEGYDTKKSLVATIRRRATPALNLAFAPGSDPAGIRALRDLMLQQASNQFQLDNASGKSHYWIHAIEGAYFLSQIHDAAPLFQKASGYNVESAELFFRKLDVLANWQTLLDLNNPDSGIQHTDLEVELYRVTEPGNLDDDAPVELVDWQAGQAVFLYGGKNLMPAFQLKLRNRGSRPLHIGLLYLDSDFSISDALLPDQILQPGSEIWATDVHNGYQYRTIPLKIETEGVTSIDEYMKLLVSTEAINTNLLCQKGLEADSQRKRSSGRKPQVEAADWTTRTICLRIAKD